MNCFQIKERLMADICKYINERPTKLEPELKWKRITETEVQDAENPNTLFSP